MIICKQDDPRSRKFARDFPLSALGLFHLRLFLLVAHQMRDLIEFGLQPLVGGALVQQLLSLLLESPPCRRQVEHLREGTAITVVYLLQLRPQIAVELVHEGQKEEAVKLRRYAPSKGLTPLCNDVLDETSNDQICSIGIPRARSLFHELQQIAVVSFVTLVVIGDGR